MDAKIEMIQRAQSRPDVTIQPSQSRHLYDADTEGDEIEEDELEENDDESDAIEEFDEGEESFAASRSPSPLTAKGLRQQHQQLLPSVSQTTEEDVDQTESESESESEVTQATSSQRTNPGVYSSPHSRPEGQHVLVPPTPVFAPVAKADKSKVPKKEKERGVSLTAVLQKTRDMTLDDDEDEAIIIPNKKTRAAAAASGGSGVVTGKKKKRSVLFYLQPDISSTLEDSLCS